MTHFFGIVNNFYLLGGGFLTGGKQEMSETLSVVQRTIERDLSTLQKNGVLKREGKDNDGMWHVINIKI